LTKESAVDKILTVAEKKAARKKSPSGDRRFNKRKLLYI